MLADIVILDVVVVAVVIVVVVVVADIAIVVDIERFQCACLLVNAVTIVVATHWQLLCFPQLLLLLLSLFITHKRHIC